MKLTNHIVQFVSLTALALCLSTAALAQQQSVDMFAGVGTAVDSNRIIKEFNGTTTTTPGVAGLFGKVGADVMLTPHVGVGIEADVRFNEAQYAGLKVRPMFSDANLIYLPTTKHWIVPEFEGGLGVSKLQFYAPTTYCSNLSGCSAVASSNHIQAHMSLGFRLYATKHLFLRPQVDVRYVNNFFQYGSDWVPEYGAALGWSFNNR